MNEDTGWAMIFAAALYAFAVFNAVQAVLTWRDSKKPLPADALPRTRDAVKRGKIAYYSGWSVFCLLAALVITFTKVFPMIHID